MSTDSRQRFVEQQDPWTEGQFIHEAFELECGDILPSVKTAYLAQGRLNAAGSNAVLVLHGYTSSHKFVCSKADSEAEGSWANLVGPGRAIDTNRYFVVAPNAMGSCFGSTGPGSTDPRTGRAYGPSFPDLTFRDIVTAQYQLTQHLGIKKLVAVAGVSMGGFCAWQWGIQYPGFMNGLVVALSSLTGRHVVPNDKPPPWSELLDHPHWNNGWVYDNNGIQPALQELRKRVLLTYGAKAQDSAVATCAKELDRRIEQQAAQWAREYDANSLIVLGEAMRRFDVSPYLDKLSARVFFMLATSDRLFPAEKAHETLDTLDRHHVPHQYLPLDTKYGHQSSGREWQKWENSLREFIEQVAQDAQHS